MKKLLCLILGIAMIFAFAGCGSDSNGSGDGSGQAAEWTREGYFDDESGNFLSVTKSDIEGSVGWYVGCMIGEDSYGNVITEENGKLHGDLVPDGEEGEFIVTVSEEGEGLMLEVEGGETYHFTEMEESETEPGITVMINVDGLGYFDYAEGEEELGPEEDFQYTSSQLNLTEAGTVTIGSRPDEGWKFVKWTKNGEDYSTDPQITAECSEDTEFVAVFEEAE